MTELYLIRHGETEWSKAGRHTSITDLPLTDVGEQQAKSLCGLINPADFQLALTSPRLRARHTAELAGFAGDHEPVVDEDLAEWSYGDYEGLTSKQIQESVPGWSIWTHPTPGGETADQVTARLNRVVNRVRESGVERAVCFAHGHALRALALCWLGFDLSLGGHFPLDTATVSVLGQAKHLPSIQQWNARLS